MADGLGCRLRLLVAAPWTCCVACHVHSTVITTSHCIVWLHPPQVTSPLPRHINPGYSAWSNGRTQPYLYMMKCTPQVGFLSHSSLPLSVYSYPEKPHIPSPKPAPCAFSDSCTPTIHSATPTLKNRHTCTCSTTTCSTS